MDYVCPEPVLANRMVVLFHSNGMVVVFHVHTSYTQELLSWSRRAEAANTIDLSHEAVEAGYEEDEVMAVVAVRAKFSRNGHAMVTQ